MQTILKNFVGGLIILFERPFRVGDVLDVNKNLGTVTSVAPSRLHTLTLMASEITRWGSRLPLNGRNNPPEA